MTNHTSLSLDQLARISGGAGTAPDPTAALKRASDLKAGGNALDLYGYSQNDTQGVGGEYRHRFNSNVSVFANGHVGTAAGKPDQGVMGGVRFEW